MEGGRRVGQAKWHDEELKMTFVSTKGCFENIFLMNTNLVKTGTQIKLGEDCGTTKFIDQFVDSRNWELILYGDSIKSTLVNTKTIRAVFFLNQEHRRREWAMARTDDALV